MANTNTALIVPEFSATRQADINNGNDVAYPQYSLNKYCDVRTKKAVRVFTHNKFVKPGQVIGRLYFPKGHSQRTKSWFYDKIDVIYDSWKSNGFAGWTHSGNSSRVVQFVLKPGVDPSIWLEVAKNFVSSNIRYVQDITRRLLEDLRKFLKRKVQRVSEIVKVTAIQVFKKVQTVIAEFVDSEPEVRTVTTPTQFLLPPASTPKPNIVDVRDIISRLLKQEVAVANSEKVKVESNPVPLMHPTRSDYNFTLKYKPRTYKRLTKYFKLGIQLTKENAIDSFIQNCISPYAIKRALNPRHRK